MWAGSGTLARCAGPGRYRGVPVAASGPLRRRGLQVNAEQATGLAHDRGAPEQRRLRMAANAERHRVARSGRLPGRCRLAGAREHGALIARAERERHDWRVALLRGARVGARLDDPERVDHRDQRSDLVRGNDLDFERWGVAGHGPRDIDLVHPSRDSLAHRPRDDPLDLGVNAHARAAAREVRDLYQQLATA